MNNLGLYYNQQKDYDNMMKYYLMAIDKGDDKAMNNLGVYTHFKIHLHSLSHSK